MAFDMVLLTLLYFVLLAFWSRAGIAAAVHNSAVNLCVCGVLFVTLMPFYFPFKAAEAMQINWSEIHWRPFEDLIHGYDGAVSGVLLNILMMIPLGFLLSKSHRHPFAVAAIVLCFSIFIETVQLFYCFANAPMHRVCDSTDVITNVTGGILGHLLRRIWTRIFPMKGKVGRKSYSNEYFTNLN